MNQRTSKGVLKKKAREEMGLTFVDALARDEQEAERQRLEFNEYAAVTIKRRGYHTFAAPYAFSHISALNEKNEPVTIHESVFIGPDNREITATPKALYELLTHQYENKNN